MLAYLRLLAKSRRERRSARSANSAELHEFLAVIREGWDLRQRWGMTGWANLDEEMEIFAIGCFQKLIETPADYVTISALPTRAQWDIIIEGIASTKSHPKAEFFKAKGALANRYAMLTVRPETSLDLPLAT